MTERITMATSNRARLAQRKEAYRLWFEYLRLARMSTNPRIKHALNGTKTKQFYALWEMDKNVEFREWWYTHSSLFEERYFVRELKPKELPQDPDALIIEVPLTLSASALAKKAHSVIKHALLRKRSTAKKNKKRPTAAYKLSEGAEPKLLAVREMLTVYRDVYLKNKNLRGQKLLDEVHKFYLGRRDEQFAKIPPALTVAKYEDTNRVLRNMRRYIQNAEHVVLNVARGEFPGKY